LTNQHTTTYSLVAAESSQTYVEAMRGQLHGATSPLDATLETVLPGVHERLDANRKTTEDLVGKVTELTSTVMASIENSRDFSMERLESEINLMLRRIREPLTEDEETNVDSTAVNPPIQEQVTNNNLSNCNTLPTIPTTYNSLHQLHNHWNGDGEYENMYPGGIARLEESKGSSWRKNWDNSANKRLSKMKAIVTAIQREASENHITSTEVLEMWEEIYSIDCKGKLSNFHSWAVSNGKIVPKKARGRSCDMQNT
jgi:hypothetical protein